MKLDNNTIMFLGDKSIPKIYVGLDVVYEKSNAPYSLGAEITEYHQIAGTLLGIKKADNSISLTKDTEPYEYVLYKDPDYFSGELKYNEDLTFEEDSMTFTHVPITLIYEDNDIMVFRLDEDTSDVASGYGYNNVYKVIENS